MIFVHQMSNDNAWSLDPSYSMFHMQLWTPATDLSDRGNTDEPLKYVNLKPAAMATSFCTGDATIVYNTCSFPRVNSMALCDVISLLG